MDFPNRAASFMLAIPSLEKVCSQVIILNDSVIMGVTSFTFDIFFWLEASHRSHPHTRERIIQECKYQEAGRRQGGPTLESVQHRRQRKQAIPKGPKEHSGTTSTPPEGETQGRDGNGPVAS